LQPIFTPSFIEGNAGEWVYKCFGLKLYKKQEFCGVMIASIDHEQDIRVYMSSEEVEKLKTGSLEGILVKWHKPKQQGIIVVSVNDVLKINNDTSGVGVVFTEYNWKNVGKVELFLRAHFYSDLVANGKNGVRYGTVGSKVHVYNLSIDDFDIRSAVKSLEFYCDNKDRLPADFG
jgi:hypothetical protein